MSTLPKVPTTPNIIGNQNKVDFIKDLAEQLAYNYLSSSFGDGNKPDLHVDEICKSDVCSDGQTKFAKKFAGEDRVRNILLIGAGASYDAYKGIPLGKGLIQEMKEQYEKEITAINFLSDKFRLFESEIKDITQHPDLNFENYLYILSEHFVTQKELRKKIKEMTGFRYAVSLFNEIVAHMLKHSFIDVVINMNFEETLDQAIKEEIGSPNYVNVLSDGDCVNLEDVLVDGRLKTPFYIKPHGTFGHKSTLRFTERHYLDLPEDIKQLLRALLSGKRSPSRRRIERINLICVGYAMASFELNKIINECLPEESVIYHIDFNSLNEEALLKSFGIFTEKAYRKGRTFEQFYKNFSTQGFSQNTIQKLEISQDSSSIKKINNTSANLLTHSLGELFSILWRTQYNMFKNAYKPRSIVRHEIISYLFYHPWLGRAENMDSITERKRLRRYLKDNIEEHPKFFLDRVIVEIAIILNRNNGILDIPELLKGRVGTYYKKYEETFYHNPNKVKKLFTIYEILEEFTDKNDPAKAIQKSVDDLSDHQQSGRSTSNESSTIYLFTLKMMLQENYTDADIWKISEALMQNFSSVRIDPDSDVILAEKDELLKSLQDYFFSLFRKKKVNKKENNASSVDAFLKLNRTCTLLFRLFSSNKLSNRFKLNFLKNHNKYVYNGKVLDEAGNKNPYNTMLEELFRLFSKSVGSHYFVINSQAKNPAHFFWESFSQKKLVHTNLALSYEINNLFLRREWDVVLSVSDTGSWLKSLGKMTIDDEIISKELEERCRGRKIIIICSREHIQQLYPSLRNNKQQLIEEHRKSLCSGFLNPANVILFMLPFNQHNNHVISFLKAAGQPDLRIWKDIAQSWTLLEQPAFAQSKYCFSAVGSVYMHRQGFSSNIDPLYIGFDSNETTNGHYKSDQERLLQIFVQHILRIQKRNGEYSSYEEKFLNEIKVDELKSSNSPHNDFLEALYKYISQEQRF